MWLVYFTVHSEQIFLYLIIIKYRRLLFILIPVKICNSGQDSNDLLTFPLTLASSKGSWAWQPYRQLTSVSKVLRFCSPKIFIAEPICLFTFRIVRRTAVLQLEGLWISTNSSFFCHACPRPLQINCRNSWRIRRTSWGRQSEEGR